MHEFGNESDVVEILVKLERVSAEATLLRELFIQKDERISQMTGELGELRAMMVRTESANQDNVAKIEKVNSILKTLDPMEIEKTLAMKEKMIVEAQASVEKMEKMLEDLRTSYVDLAAKIDKLGNFESISRVYKDVDTSLSTVKRKENNINLTAGKVETTFFEMEKRLKEFEKAKPMMERTEDLSNELIKNLNDINIKMTNFISREDLGEVRQNIEKDVKDVRKGLEDQWAKAAEELQGIKKSLTDATAEVASLKGLTNILRDSVNKMEENSKDTQMKITEEIGELKATLAESAPGVEQLPVNMPEAKEIQEALRQDFEKYKEQLEEKMSHIPTSVESSSEGGLESPDRLNELSASLAKMENELQKLARQVDESPQKGVETEGRISSLEEMLRNMNDSLNTLSEKSGAVREIPEVDIEDLKNVQKQFEENINIQVSQSKETSDEAIENVNRLNEQLPGIVEAVDKLVSVLEEMEDSGKRVRVKGKRIKEIKGKLVGIVKNIRR